MSITLILLVIDWQRKRRGEERRGEKRREEKGTEER